MAEDGQDGDDGDDTVTIEMRTQSEEFEYADHACKVSYGGLSPKFHLDGNRIPLWEIEEVVDHAGRGMQEWKQSLRRYIDQEVESDGSGSTD